MYYKTVTVTVPLMGGSIAPKFDNVYGTEECKSLLCGILPFHLQ